VQDRFPVLLKFALYQMIKLPKALFKKWDDYCKSLSI